MSSVSVVLSLALVAMVKSQEFQPIATGIAADRCFEPVSTGHCRARFPSFHYNPLTETCDCFIFGGCAANGNKFTTLDECMNTCGVNPQLQTISLTCVRIFGAENPKLTVSPRTINSRPAPVEAENPKLTVSSQTNSPRPAPLVFSLETSPPSPVTDNNVVIVKTSTSTAAPVTEATTTPATSTIAPSATTPATSSDAPTTTTPATSSAAPTSASSSSSTTNSPTSAASSTVSPTTVSTSTKPVPRKPTSTPGPWDHWLNL